MRPVSEKFLNSLRGSGGDVFQAFVVAAGQTGVEPTGTEISILSGTVDLDATAAIRSVLDMSTDGRGTFPDNADDSFAPYGNEIFVRRGQVFGGGSLEWVSLGYHRIHSVEQSDHPGNPLDIIAYDRMAGIIDFRLLEVVQYPATATFGDVVEELVTEVYPWATIEWDDTTDTDPIARSVIAEEDRYGFLNDLVTSRGKIWYWDHRGVLVIKTPPDPDEPVWAVNAGTDGVLVSMSRDISREGVYNAVKASGEALDTEAPPSATAVDDNPDSPTYWNGSFGKVPRFYESPFLTTVGQAQSAAEALLRQKLGLPYRVGFSSVTNPALEPYDAVAINTSNVARVEPRVIAQDSFGVASASGWLVDELGNSYTQGGTITNWTTSGGLGKLTIAAGSTGTSHLVGIDESDIEGVFVANPPAVAGAPLVYGALARYTDGSNHYAFRIEFNTGGTVAAKIHRYTAGSYTEIAVDNPINGLSFTAEDRWMVRYRAVGTTLKMRIWLEGEVEPTSWTLSATDSDHTSGEVGFFFWRITSNTSASPQFRIDDWQVKTFPGAAMGDEVHVIERLTIPLYVEGAMSADTREQTQVVIGEA